MIVGVQGSRNFNDYSVFLRAIGTTLSMLDKAGDKELVIMSAGPSMVNSFALEFVNVSERSLKARGIRAKVVRVPAAWFKSNMHDINYFMYFSLPKESVSDLVKDAEDKDIDVGIYRYA
jgi:hypothetical protein